MYTYNILYLIISTYALYTYIILCASPVYCTDDKGTLAVLLAEVFILYYSPFFYRRTKAVSFRICMLNSRIGIPTFIGIIYVLYVGKRLPMQKKKKN